MRQCLAIYTSVASKNADVWRGKTLVKTPLFVALLLRAGSLTIRSHVTDQKKKLGATLQCVDKILKIYRKFLMQNLYEIGVIKLELHVFWEDFGIILKKILKIYKFYFLLFSNFLKICCKFFCVGYHYSNITHPFPWADQWLNVVTEGGMGIVCARPPRRLVIYSSKEVIRDYFYYNSSLNLKWCKMVQIGRITRDNVRREITSLWAIRLSSQFVISFVQEIRCVVVSLSLVLWVKREISATQIHKIREIIAVEFFWSLAEVWRCIHHKFAGYEFDNASWFRVIFVVKFDMCAMFMDSDYKTESLSSCWITSKLVCRKFALNS